MADQAVLEFDIKINASLSDETKETLADLENQKKEKTETPQDSANNLLESEGEFTADQLAQIQSTIGEELGGLDKGQLMKLGAMGKNPTAAISNLLKQAGGSGILKFLGPIAIATIAVEVTIQMIKLLNTRGGPLNRDFRRFIQDEVQVGLSREQQKRLDLGIDQTILTQVSGFRPNNENWTYNSLFEVNETRISRIGMSDREAGVTMVRV